MVTRLTVPGKGALDIAYADAATADAADNCVVTGLTVLRNSALATACLDFATRTPGFPRILTCDNGDTTSGNHQSRFTGTPLSKDDLVRCQHSW